MGKWRDGTRRPCGGKVFGLGGRTTSEMQRPGRVGSQTTADNNDHRGKRVIRAEAAPNETGYQTLRRQPQQPTMPTLRIHLLITHPKRSRQAP